MSDLRLRFLSRSGCHLCDEARPLVLKAAKRVGATIEELDVDSRSELKDRFGDRVPVVLTHDGDVVAEGSIGDIGLLTRRLRQLAGSPG